MTFKAAACAAAFFMSRKTCMTGAPANGDKALPRLLPAGLPAAHSTQDLHLRQKPPKTRSTSYSYRILTDEQGNDMSDTAKQQKKLKKRIQAIKERKTSGAQDIADAVLTFCRPLLQESQALNGEDNAVGLGVFAWNAAFLTKDRWSANLKNSLGRFNLSTDAQEALEGIVEEMIRQKKLMHPNDMRVITHYDVKVADGKLELTVDAKVATKPQMPKFNDLPQM